MIFNNYKNTVSVQIILKVILYKKAIILLILTLMGNLFKIFNNKINIIIITRKNS